MITTGLNNPKFFLDNLILFLLYSGIRCAISISVHDQ